MAFTRWCRNSSKARPQPYTTRRSGATGRLRLFLPDDVQFSAHHYGGTVAELPGVPRSNRHPRLSKTPLTRG
jgi:hypothetical protein